MKPEVMGNETKNEPKEDLEESTDEVTEEQIEGAPETRTPYRQCAPDHFRTRLHVSYDGTEFSGWQRQRQAHLTTVQGTLESALTQIYDKPIRVLGASRTDAGVHANLQVAHFDAPRDPSVFDLRYAIQCLTPESLVVKEVLAAPVDFHAIACASDKIYKYRVLNRVVPSALRRHTTYWVRYPLNLDFLNAAAHYLVGKQDFKSFQSSGTPVLSTIRTITRAEWTQLDEDTLEFTVQGNGFLKQMVRNIVGTLIDLNQDERPPETIVEFLKLRDRRKIGPTAPPQGLFLYRVNYPESIDKKCRKL